MLRQESIDSVQQGEQQSFRTLIVQAQIARLALNVEQPRAGFHEVNAV
jgi:hypothetical protein